MIKLNDVIPYTYKELQDDGFEAIICEFLNNTEPSEQPEFVHMLGIPGAGKSTFYQKNAKQFSNYIFISFDAIMEAHPQYQKDIKELGSVEAFNKWEIPARIAGYELLFRAIKAKKNIFLDHGGTPKCHQELLLKVKQLGYKTKIYYIFCPIEVAIARTKTREAITKRHTPVNIITDRAKIIETNLEIYKSITDEFISVT